MIKNIGLIYKTLLLRKKHFSTKNKKLKGRTVLISMVFIGVMLINLFDTAMANDITISQNSLYAHIHGQVYDIYKGHYFYGLPWIMRDEGYEKAIEEINKSIHVLENDKFRQALKEKKEYNGVEIIKKQVQCEKLIAHAGGRIKGLTYTNCKEAFDKSYEDGYKFIEVDFEWTTDGQPVLLHSWDGFLTKFFGVEPKRYSLKVFRSFDMINNWHQMTLESLTHWMKEHPDVYIITDVKDNNLKLLSLISQNYPDLQKQIIPQIYFMDEYIRAEHLGYKNIIYTLYRSSNTAEEIVDFAKHNKLLAITMPIAKAKTDLPKVLGDIGVFSYSHTINDIDLAKMLEDQGIDGFYTDDLKIDKKLYTK